MLAAVRRLTSGIVTLGWLLGVLTLVSLSLSASAQGAPGTINPLQFAGADLCLKIKTAIAANAASNPQGLIIDARSATGIQPCSVNPLGGATVPGQLLLGTVVLQTTATIMTPSIPGWQILGIGRGNNINQTGTLIEAVSGFPANSPVVRLGDGTNLAFGNRIENLSIDCNNVPNSGVTGSTGLYSTDIQEQSGGSFLDIVSCQSRGLWINGSGVGQPAPSPYTAGIFPFADNYEFHDVEFEGPSTSNPAQVGCEFDGGFAHQGNGPHTINALTCNIATTAFVFDGISASSISNLNAESATTGYMIGNNAPLNGVMFEGLNSGTISQDVIHIKNFTPTAAQPNFTQGVSFSNIVNGGAFAPVTLQDDILGVTLHDFVIGSYTIGTHVPRGVYTNLSSSPSTVSLVPQLTIDNGTNAVNVLKFGSGNTSAAGSILEYDDRGVSRWNLGTDSSNNFQLFDWANNVLRFFAPTVSFPYTAINSVGSAPVFFNTLARSGSGGVQFGSGGASPVVVASVNSTGIGTFAGLAIPSLGASSRPLCTTTGGVIVNTGCSARSAAATTGSALAKSDSLSGGVASVFGRTGPVVAGSGDYSVTQIDGAAPINNPAFTGAMTSPSIGGIGNASFSLGTNELVGGSEAAVSCASGHICDSYSGTIQLVTGSGSISFTGSPAVTITLPLARANTPNCLIAVTNNVGTKPLTVAWGYPNTSSVSVTPNTVLSSATTYNITYLCGGN